MLHCCRPRPIALSAFLSAFPCCLMAAPEPADRLLDAWRASGRDAQWPRQSVGPVAAPALRSDPADVEEPGAAVNVQQIRIDSAGLMHDADSARIVQPFLAVPLGRRRIELLLRQLDAQLVEAGWITSRARLLAFDQEQATLSIELIPGRMAGVRAAGLQSDALARAMPVKDGDVLSLQAVEQGVKQINRLRMYQAQARILPGNVAGTSLLDILLTEGRSWSLGFGFDNQGTRTTGSGRLRVTGRVGDLFGALDDMQFAYLKSARSDAVLASVTLPAGYGLWSATVSGSRSSFEISGLELTSCAFTGVLSWNRVLTISRERRDALDLSLSRAALDRSVEGTDLAGEHTTVLRAAWTRIGHGERFQYYVEPALSIGVSLLGATRDASALQRADSHRQFARWVMGAGVVVRSDGGAVEYAGQLTIQHSNTGLVGSEQLHVGGLASVRGFEEAVESGDRGYVMRNELRLPEAFRSAPFPAVPFLHVDQGVSRRINAPSDTLASVGIGARGASGGLLWEGVASLPVRHGSAREGDGWRVHFSVSFEI
jgi:hemolysin activation/secretion protein